MLWLSGWFYRKSHLIDPAAGAGAGYQVRVKVHYGSGADSGEDVYCNSLCRTDFGDMRFTDDDNGLLDYWLQNKTDGDNAVFWVKIAASLETSTQTLYVYYGKSDESTTSSQANTFIDVLSGVLAAWNMEDSAGSTITDFSGNGNHGAATGTTVVASPFFAGKNARQLNGTDDKISRSTTTTLPANLANTGNWALVQFYRIADPPISGNNNMFMGVYHAPRISKSGSSLQITAFVGGVYSNLSVLTNGGFSVGVNHVLVAQQRNNVSTELGADGATIQTAAFRRIDNAGSYVLGGNKTDDGDMFTGVLGPLFVFSSALSQTQFNNICAANIYPDAGLEAGKVLLRRWASSTQPAHDAWGGVERLVISSDLVGAVENPFGHKGFLVSDSLIAVEVVSALKTLFVGDGVNLDDVALALKNLHVTNSLIVLDSVSVPQRVRSILESVCLVDGLRLDRVLVVADDVFVLETLAVGRGDRRTRLFLVMGDVAVQLTGSV